MGRTQLGKVKADSANCGNMNKHGTDQTNGGKGSVSAVGGDGGIVDKHQEGRMELTGWVKDWSQLGAG